MAKPKTAIVLIHGIGEQRPMDTLWGFVKAAWVHDPQLVHPSRDEVWSKPELVTGSFELRRVTTREGSYGDKRRCDFFEFYWAHRMQGHTLGGLVRWSLGLFVRRPSAVPKGLLLAWAAGLGLLIGAFVIAILAWSTDLARTLDVPGWLVAAAPIALAIGSFVVHAIVLPHAGDAARYLSPEPVNVDIRQRIREDGVDLLEKLTARGEYDRIVLAGHSLGSVIAYDILNFAWNRLEGRKLAERHSAGSDAMTALAQLEEAASALDDAAPDQLGQRRIAYRGAQRRYARALASGEDPLWIVSDLVTLGSPLSKADILVGRSASDLAARIARREIPSAPPISESDGERCGFSYPLSSEARRPHHAAAFAPVVWTNLYHPNRFIWFGDIISGPLRGLFGKGVLDVRLPIGRPPGFRHLDYWARPEARPAGLAIRALRRALNLRGRAADEDIWGEQAGAQEVLGHLLPEEA